MAKQPKGVAKQNVPAPPPKMPQMVSPASQGRIANLGAYAHPQKKKPRGSK
jgi:hypothetical protein